MISFNRAPKLAISLLVLFIMGMVKTRKCITGFKTSTCPVYKTIHWTGGIF